MTTKTPRNRILPPATKKIETAIGMIIRSAQRSGWRKTRIRGMIILNQNGIKPCCKSAREFLYRLQKEATVNMIESFKNSVGWREKGSHGISNHHRAPLILMPNIRTATKSPITSVAMSLVFFFHQR